MKKIKGIFALCFLFLLILAFCAVIFLPKIEKIIYPIKFQEYVETYSQEYSVPESLVYAVIYNESHFDPQATSAVGAQGLMQLMPETLSWLSTLQKEAMPTGEITDAETNIKYGTYYLSYLYGRFGDWETALAAYNAGHGRVLNWLDDTSYSEDGKTLKQIPLAETEEYVKKVTDTWKRYEEIYYGA